MLVGFRVKFPKMATKERGNADHKDLFELTKKMESKKATVKWQPASSFWVSHACIAIPALIRRTLNLGQNIPKKKCWLQNGEFKTKDL